MGRGLEAWQAVDGCTYSAHPAGLPPATALLTGSVRHTENPHKTNRQLIKLTTNFHHKTFAKDNEKDSRKEEPFSVTTAAWWQRQNSVPDPKLLQYSEIWENTDTTGPQMQEAEESVRGLNTHKKVF